MSSHDRLGRTLQHIPKSGFRSVRNVDENTTAVHLSNQLSTEGAQATPTGTSLVRRTVAHIVVAGVAQRNIGDSLSLHPLHLSQIASYSIRILYTYEESFLPLCLQASQIIGRAGNATPVGIHGNLPMYGCQQMVHTIHRLLCMQRVAHILPHPTSQVLPVQATLFHFRDANLRFRARTYII